MKQKELTERILTLLGPRKRGRTKNEIARVLQASHPRVSVIVNQLVQDGRLRIVGYVKPATGRPAPVYKRVESTLLHDGRPNPRH